MDKIIRSDHLFFRFMDKLGMLIFINILWLIGCIPIVTVGVSSIAMYDTVITVIRREKGYAFRSFCKSYKKNQKNGIICGISIIRVKILSVE